MDRKRSTSVSKIKHFDVTNTDPGHCHQLVTATDRGCIWEGMHNWLRAAFVVRVSLNPWVSESSRTMIMIRSFQTGFMNLLAGHPSEVEHPKALPMKVRRMPTYDDLTGMAQTAVS